ncbi:OmpA family protein [Alkalispirochaeta americana]|uniref:OmpA family protein n=1 Tax=Alkalispirochaeta americana TaxID=159291 RepID=UPI001F417F17|nr:OmpA family protein [Alkalispirochaeta americana]
MANRTQFAYGLADSLEFMARVVAVNYRDDDFYLGTIAALEGRVTGQRPEKPEVMAYGGFIYHRDDLRWKPYQGNVPNVASVISPYGDPGWDLYCGVSGQQNLSVFHQERLVMGTISYARTLGRDHFPDTEGYKNRIFLNVAPVLWHRSFGQGRVTWVVQNRATLWMERGYMVEVLPQVVIDAPGNGVAFHAGLGLPAVGGGVYRFLAGFRVKVPPVRVSQEQAFITVTDLFFPPNQAVLLGPENERSGENRKILRRLYRDLRQYPGYTVLIEGHTSFVHWDDPLRGPLEQQQVLLPLSQARADAVRDALVDLGIDRARMQTVGKGAQEPVVPFGDSREQWKNRRVELILSPPDGSHSEGRSQ